MRREDAISIHAPLAGCDNSTSTYRRLEYDFNPRTPCGVRPAKDSEIALLKAFQSTHPLRGATTKAGYHARNWQFQSTHPLRGATTVEYVTRKDFDISIHAPLAGCDSCDTCGATYNWLFQSTHPLRGATYRALQDAAPHGISIHAPLAGCDERVGIKLPQILDFNPRTPCGVRQYLSDGKPVYVVISIHAPLAGCDVSRVKSWRRKLYFNPRTPCGVRQQNCRNIPGKFAQKLQNFCKAEQRAALPRVGQRESGRYFRPCAVRTSRGKPERFRFASDNERALRSVARLCAEVLDAGFILVSKVIKA